MFLYFYDTDKPEWQQVDLIASGAGSTGLRFGGAASVGLGAHRDPPDDSITKDQGQFVPLAASVNLRVYEVCT